MTTESPVAAERLVDLEALATPGAATPPETQAQVWMTFEGLAMLAFAVALGALLLAAFSIGLASRAIDEHRAIPEGEATAAEVAPVGLREFEIGSAPIEVSAGSVLRFVNEGTTVHDVAIEGSGATPELQPGEEAELDLSDLEPGTYTAYCQLPGHRDSGMETTIIITD